MHQHRRRITTNQKVFPLLFLSRFFQQSATCLSTPNARTKRKKRETERKRDKRQKRGRDLCVFLIILTRGRSVQRWMKFQGLNIMLIQLLIYIIQALHFHFCNKWNAVIYAK